MKSEEAMTLIEAVMAEKVVQSNGPRFAGWVDNPVKSPSDKASTISKITHEQAFDAIAKATTEGSWPGRVLRAYNVQQRESEAADRVLLDRCFQLLTYLGLDDEPIVERLRARLGKENSNG